MGALNELIIKTLRTQQAIPWDGGDCPVATDQTVLVEHRMSGLRGKYSLGTASKVRWKHDGSGSDVLAYIVVERGTLEEDK